MENLTEDELAFLKDKYLETGFKMSFEQFVEFYLANREEE